MSAVESRTTTVTRYEWRARDYGHGVAVGDIHDAIAFASAKYRDLSTVGREPTSDDWLHARGDEDGITFWFEREESDADPIGDGRR